MASAPKPRSQSPRPGDVRPERNPANSGYSQHMHNRQTSIVNGMPHRSGLHSRSGSYVNSPATSPLSPLPVMQAATITPSDMIHIPQIPPSPMTGAPMMNIASVTSQPAQIQLPPIPSSPGTSTFSSSASSLVNTANTLPATGVHAADRPGLFTQHSTPAVMQIQKPPRRQHPSGSSHHATKSGVEESKTPAEYALHILFTQVGDTSRYPRLGELI